MADTSGTEIELNPNAVLPSSLLRGSIIGLLLTTFAYVHFIMYWEWTSLLVAPLAPVRSVLVGLTLPASVVAIAALALVGYRRRQYHIDRDGVTKRGGLIRSHERTVGFDAITDVTLTRSKLQGAFGVGTICLTYDDGDDERRLWLSYVRDPTAVYDRLRSDCGGTVRSPETTIEPDPVSAARQGAMKGVFLTPVLGAIPAVILVAIAFLSNVSLAVSGLAIAGIGVVLIALLAIRSYLRYDGRRYELYRTHVESVTGADRSSISFDDVASVTASGEATGTVKLLDRDEESLLTLRHVPNPETVRSKLQRLIDT